MIPQDYHMHSNFSPDCKIPMAEMCQNAVDKGLPEIGFTEHYDLHPREKTRNYFQPEPWWAEVERCRAAFAGRLTIRAGIEIGEPHMFQAEAQAMLARYPFDYALGSLHWVGDESIFWRRYFTQRTPDEAFQTFFIELARMTRVGGFDILSHFDVPLRTAFPVYGHYDPLRYEHEIRAVLQNCIDHGIALDLNTASLRKGAPAMTPGLDILRWYAEMGGARVTLGSDAHRPVNIGNNLVGAMATAQEAGIDHVTQFEAREARLVPMAQQVSATDNRLID